MNTRRYILSIATIALLASCSTNQDLAQLEEYDDLYYTPAPREIASQAYSSSEFTGANSAESSYYGESPYVDESEKPSSEFNDKSMDDELAEESDDYYDPNYANRIENFHRGDNPNYVYGDAFANNMSPQFYGGINMNSFNGFNNTGFGFGIAMGNPWMGNRWCDPFFDPFCNQRPWGTPGFGINMGWGATWGMYDPFSPWNRSFMAYNPYGWRNPYAYNPYGFNPYGYNPYLGSGAIIVDNGGNSRGFQNTTRNSGSSRTSRGGVVGSSSDRRRGAIQNNDGPKSSGVDDTQRQRSTTRTRPTRSSADTDYYNRTNSRQYSQPNGINRTTRSASGNSNGQTTQERPRQVASPYTRQRSRETSSPQTPDYSRYNRSNSNNTYNSTRSRRNSNSYSSPTRSRTTTPSISSPTRSRSTITSPRSSSPGRSTGGGSRRR